MLVAMSRTRGRSTGDAIGFFLSSRRRHTRSLCDWSSDVCSSDLTEAVVGYAYRREVIEVRVLGQGAQPVVPHRTVRVADHGLGVTAVVELAKRVVTERVVQLADHAPVRFQLELEAVTEHPRGPLITRRVGLFRVIPAILDRARELYVFPL